LLRENGAARARLVQLCRHGDFLAAQIAAHPLLLDELIDARLLSQPPTRAGFARELESRMEQLRAEDPEQQVEACGSSSARPCFASRSRISPACCR